MSEDKDEPLGTKRAYVKLSYKGQQEYKEMEREAIKKFLFWVFVGNLGGLVLGQSIKYLPFKDTSQIKMKRLQRIGFFISIFAFSYHGYKLSKFDFIKQKKKLLSIPENIVQEPDN